MDFNSFWADLLVTILGGMGIALLFFFVKEKLCPWPDIAGRWYFEITTEVSSYNPYKGMVLRYVAMMWRDGSQLAGTVEKISELSINGNREFVGVNRTRGIISGSIQKNYLGADKLFVHVIEDGHGRESTYFHSVEPYEATMQGRFHTMVADQAGTVIWQRKPF